MFSSSSRCLANQNVMMASDTKMAQINYEWCDSFLLFIQCAKRALVWWMWSVKCVVICITATITLNTTQHRGDKWYYVARSFLCLKYIEEEENAIPTNHNPKSVSIFSFLLIKFFSKRFSTEMIYFLVCSPYSYAMNSLLRKYIIQMLSVNGI